MSAPVLSVRNLTTSFLIDRDVRVAVRDVSFDVGARETVAIVGESGSGKSVTALSIMRLLENTVASVSGDVLLGDLNLLKLSEKRMQRIRGSDIAMVFQEPMTSLNPVLTVGDQIMEVLAVHRGFTREETRHEAVALLEKVRIPDAKRRMDDYPQSLSGGMRQRVMIAMALACRPKLLIADEPTTALDVTIQAQILSLLRVLQEEEGMSMIFITHDMGVVAEIADRTLVMLNGGLVEENTTGRLFAHPSHSYTRALLSAVPRLGSMRNVLGPRRFPILDKDAGSSSADNEVTGAKADTATVLEIRNLTARFDIRSGILGRVANRIHAVENVSLSVRSGETLALVGESGCGKSTIGRCIMRLIEPQSGDILVQGRDIGRLSGPALRAVRRNVQMVFQDPFASLDPRCTVGFSIAEPLFRHGLASPRQARDRIAALLLQVGLSSDMASRYPHEFSGGQRQRICIARALALEPKLLVADESVSALDVSVKAQIINLLLDLQERLGLAYLFISHDMAVVERISHRVAVMYMGEIVETGPRGAVFDDPSHPYTKRLLSAVPVPDPQLRRPARPPSSDEIRSPMRPADYSPSPRSYREVSPGHIVQLWDRDWDDVKPAAFSTEAAHVGHGMQGM